MANKILKVCIILPAFNEVEVIQGVLKGVPRQLRSATTQFQLSIIVVDDGSSDGTADKARLVHDVTVLKHPVNLGAGAATRTGLHYARDHSYDLALTMDADGQHAPADIRQLLIVMSQTVGTDLLIGGRLSGDGNMPRHKIIGNRLLSYYTFLLFGIYVSDSQSGFRVFSNRALHELDFHTNGYGFCSEIIWQAKRVNLQVREHPVTAIYTEYSQRKGQKSYSGGLQILQQIFLRRLSDIVS